LRIGIDGYNLSLPHGTGVATYGYVLSETLKAMGHQVEGVFGLDAGDDPAAREVCFYDDLGRDRSRPLTRGEIKQARRRIGRAALWPFAKPLVEVPLGQDIQSGSFADRLPRFDRLFTLADLFEVAHRHFKLFGRFLPIRMAAPPEIMHWTYPVPVRLEGSRNIYTLHDIVPIKLPHTTLDVKADYHRLLECCLQDADHLCTVSERSLEDIVAHFGISRDRITNTYQASPTKPGVLRASPEEDAAMIEGIFGFRRQDYFLFFGAIEPKKNLGRLIEAYLATRTEAKLVIVGSRGWRSEEELRLLTQNEGSAHGQRLAERVVRLDYMPRPLLLRLIRGARAVAFPSLYEGFGLPVLEAMQLGVPLLASNSSSLPEVAGDAAVYADPYDVASIADALMRLDTDPELRASLAEAGPERAALFSRERYAERLDTLYARTLA
jgi:glycosyltransferase involved in cell wall biosynthesis